MPIWAGRDGGDADIRCREYVHVSGLDSFTTDADVGDVIGVRKAPSRGASDRPDFSSVTGVMRCRWPVACRWYGALVRAVIAPS